MLATLSVLSFVSILEFSMACRMIISSCTVVSDSKRGGGRRARFCPSSTGSSHDGFPGPDLLYLRPPSFVAGSPPTPAPAPISSRPRFIVPPAAASSGVGAIMLGWAGVIVGHVRPARLGGGLVLWARRRRHRVVATTCIWWGKWLRREQRKKCHNMCAFSF